MKLNRFTNFDLLKTKYIWKFKSVRSFKNQNYYQISSKRLCKLYIFSYAFPPLLYHSRPQKLSRRLETQFVLNFALRGQGFRFYSWLDISTVLSLPERSPGAHLCRRHAQHYTESGRAHGSTGWVRKRYSIIHIWHHHFRVGPFST